MQVITRWTETFAPQWQMLAFCASFLLFAGCSQQVASVDLNEEDWFASEEQTEAGEQSTFNGTLPVDRPADETEWQTELSVNLNVGDRFPLMKTVKKTLTSSSVQGVKTIHEQIDLTFAITVEEIRQANKRLGVTYTNVKYTRQQEGNKISYDSKTPVWPIPQTAMPYHAMVNNGFSFWLGPDNKITDIVGFDTFLKQCLAQVPPSQHDYIAETLSAFSGNGGIANFVDDSIALLPYRADASGKVQSVDVGESWQRTQTINEPVPMNLENTFSLRELTESIAKIDVFGTISPTSATTAPNEANKTMHLEVTGGQSLGSCTIDRKTGLPLDSHIEHMLTMQVHMNGIQFEQQKRVVTDVRAFPEQSTPRIATENGLQESGISPVGYQAPQK